MAKKRNLRAVDAAETISDLEAFNLYIEDELEELLDEQSNEDFGNIDYREVEKRAKLNTWSAQDFSNIYLRYRPHLERHARRFLNSQTQVDEVVQDAFLYLMVTLPDLDSETGVLRFLKWKVRLICLDVLRESGRAVVNSLEDHAEMMADDPEISAGLEQADDAAIVKLALSKLNPRHREVLIASLYEEKSHEQVAAQIGLSENATRQLIFRARAAFKKALLGDDINTDGMS
ncbi:MAG: sigma-70 family RNA polymerase sigma factor, partial [Actinomycetes bacterium]